MAVINIFFVLHKIGTRGLEGPAQRPVLSGPILMYSLEKNIDTNKDTVMKFYDVM